MKRKIAFILTAALMFGLTACGTANESDDTSNSSAQTESSQVAEISEQEEDVHPELTSHIENLEEYDTIFVGYPLWWYDLPQVMYSFFDEYDFSGKTIIPFDVHRDSRLSGTPGTIQELEPDAAVISDGFAVVHETAAESVSDVVMARPIKKKALTICFCWKMVLKS